MYIEPGGKSQVAPLLCATDGAIKRNTARSNVLASLRILEHSFDVFGLLGLLGIFRSFFLIAPLDFEAAATGMSIAQRGFIGSFPLPRPRFIARADPGARGDLRSCHARSF